MGEASSFVDQRVIEDDVGAADPAVTAPAEATPAATQGAPQQEGSEVSSRLTEKLSSRADKAERELDLVVQEQNKYRALLLVREGNKRFKT